MRTRTPTPSTLNKLALALLPITLFPLSQTAFADEAEDRRLLTTPDSSISVGVGSINRDNGRFGQYLGLHERGLFAVDRDHGERRRALRITSVLAGGDEEPLDPEKIPLGKLLRHAPDEWIGV